MNDQNGKGGVNPIQIQKFLGDVDYPANKQKLLEVAKKHGADNNVINMLNRLPNRDYDSPADVTEEMGGMK